MVEATGGIVVKPYQEFQHSYSSGSIPLSPTSFTSDAGSYQVEKDDKGEGTSTGIVAAPRSGMSTAGAMAAASGKSIGAIITSSMKGTMVDIPLAVTEGLRGVPKMYGEEVKDYGQVTDWKSGALVAGKTFAFAIPEGIADLVVQPYKGAKEDGVIGFTKGIGKGAMNLAVKTQAGVLGLVAYPSQGIYKSIRASAHEKTGKGLIKSRHEEGKWLLSLEQGLLTARVIAAYDELLRTEGKGDRPTKDTMDSKIYQYPNNAR
jgi:hypothetical protein